MQEDREHKGLFGMVRSFIIEDAPEDEPQHDREPARESETRAHTAGSGAEVDKMFAELEAEAAAKSGPQHPEGPTEPAATPVQPVAAAATEVIPPEVQKVVKLIGALPAVLTPEQVKPLLAATMEAANLNVQAVAVQAGEARTRAQEGIESAKGEIARLEAEREQTLARLVKLMDAARAQCAEGVAAQQARIADFTGALNVLSRVGAFIDVSAAPDGTEKKP
jgi:hypothetical protein